MFFLRCTQKLQRRLGIRTHPAGAVASPSTTQLGDWYANLLTHHRRPVVLFVSERTLLPIVVLLAPASSLMPRFRESLAQMLLAIGVGEMSARAELREMDSHVLGRTENRRVLGSMNDFAWLLEAVPRDETLLGAALGLAEAPCSPIGMEAPRTVARDAFRSASIGLVH